MLAEDFCHFARFSSESQKRASIPQKSIALLWSAVTADAVSGIGASLALVLTNRRRVRRFWASDAMATPAPTAAAKASAPITPTSLGIFRTFGFRADRS